MTQIVNASTQALPTRYFKPSFLFIGYAVLSIVLSIFFCWIIIIHGTAGLSLDMSQKGFYVSSVKDPRINIKPGDLIQKVDTMEYEKMLHSPFHSFFTFSRAHTFTVLRDKTIITVEVSNSPLSISSFIISAFPFIMVILTLNILSLAALLRAPSGQPSHLFLVSMISFSLAVTADLPLFFGVIHPGFVSIIYILTLISGWIAFSSWAHFVFRYPVERDLLANRPFVIFFIYIIPPFVSCLLAWGIADSAGSFFSQLCRWRNIAAPFILFVLFLKSIHDVVITSDPLVKNQLVPPIIGGMFGISPYLFLHALPGLLIDRPLISANLVLLLGMSIPISVFISIIRYRLFDIHEMISKIASYIIFIVTLSLVYSLFIAGLKRWFFGRAILSEEVFLVFMVGVALVFQPVINRLEKWIDQFFYRHRPVPAKVLHSISEKITTSLHFTDLLGVIVDDLPDEIGITGAAMILVEEKQFRCYPENETFTGFQWTESNLFVHFRNTEKTYLFTHSPEKYPQLFDELVRIKAQGYSLVFPLKSTLSQPGFMFIGHRKDGRFFRKDDLHLFSSFANQVAIALENATRYETLIESKKQLEELFNQKVHKEKMALVGEMSTMLAHELRNPLGIIHSSAQYIEKGKKSEKVKKKMIRFIKDEVEHLDNTISSLLGMAKQLPPVLVQIDLNQELPKLVHQWKNSTRHDPDVEIYCQLQKYLPAMYVDLRQLTQVIHNLINNAEEMMPNGGNIHIEAVLDKNEIQIDIIDTGPGIADQNMVSVFQTFFTTKEKGLGLGLAVCQQIVSAHNGKLDLKNRRLKGLRACIRLPLKPLATGATTQHGPIVWTHSTDRKKN